MDQNIKNSNQIELKEMMDHLLIDLPSCSLKAFHELANQILQKNYEKLKENDALVRTTHNSEAIHQMRVAIRRLRAAMKTFEKYLPKKIKNYRTELQKLSRVLGKKRDLDVFSQFILHMVSAKSIQNLEQKSNRAQKRILSMLNSKYYDKLMRSLEQLKVETTKQKKLMVSSNRISKEVKKVQEIAPFIDSKVDDKTLHQLRIAFKKLRYTCEFFEPIFKKNMSFISSFIEKTKRIQDVLGTHQDAITGISMLIRFKSEFTPEEVLKIQNKYERKRMKTRKLFQKIWKKLD